MKLADFCGKAYVAMKAYLNGWQSLKDWQSEGVHFRRFHYK